MASYSLRIQEVPAQWDSAHSRMDVTGVDREGCGPGGWNEKLEIAIC